MHGHNMQMPTPYELMISLRTASVLVSADEVIKVVPLQSARKLRMFRSGPGTERNSALPPLACLGAEVQQTRIEAVSTG